MAAPALFQEVSLSARRCDILRRLRFRRPPVHRAAGWVGTAGGQVSSCRAADCAVPLQWSGWETHSPAFRGRVAREFGCPVRRKWEPGFFQKKIRNAYRKRPDPDIVKNVASPALASGRRWGENPRAHKPSYFLQFFKASGLNLTRNRRQKGIILNRFRNFR